MTNEQLETVRMIRQAIAESREELKQEIQNLRAELKADIQEVRSELKADIQEVRAEIQALRTEMNDRFEKVDESMEYVRANISEHDEDVFRIKRLLKAVT
jgi:uncharacterized coiled-coil DUF342 family protein